MKLSALLIGIVAATVLFLSEAGCSWINWQKIPENDTNSGRIYCGSSPAVLDTIMTAAFAGGAAGLYVADSENARDCRNTGEGYFGCRNPGFIIGAAIVTTVAAIWAAASFSGWVNYGNCRAYNKRLDEVEKLGTSEKLFHPETSEKPTDDAHP
jgi:hypothetical protein